MNPLTESEIRAAFVNCTKGEAKRRQVERTMANLTAFVEKVTA